MATTAQRSFASGEIAPALYPRTDLAKYAIGLRTCRNMIILRQGGADYRPGTDLVCEVADSSKPVRLLKFKFNIHQTFVLEFGNLYIRFVQNGAPVVSGGVPYQIVSPYTTAELSGINSVQQGDVITLVHANHPPYELKRLASTNWTLTPINFDAPLASPTGPLTVVPGAAGTVQYGYAVTSVDANGTESTAPYNGTGGLSAVPTSALPNAITWTPVAGAVSYRVYATPLGAPWVYPPGLIGETNLPKFNDPGIIPDLTDTLPVARPLFDSAGNYPQVVGYYQQRLIFANTLNNPSTVWASRTGDYHNFRLQGLALQDDNPVTFTLASDEIDAIKHLLNLGKLIIGTEGGEWLIEGDNAGVLTPSNVNARIGSYNGANALKPIKVDSTILYVQSLGNKILDLKTNIVYGYYTFQASDQTLISAHLFLGETITDWDDQQNPNVIAWAVRSDGVLLGYTYYPDQQLAAWHRHDTDGTFENVCVVPEGSEDRLYVVVNRTINGATKRYIERLRTLDLVDIIADSCFMDSTLEYDGRNAGGGTITMTLSGGTTWAYDELLTITASGSYFGGVNVGDAIFLHGPSGELVKFTLNAISSTTVATGYANKTVPVDMQNAAVTLWDRAVPAVSGAAHLEGKAVSVFADGFVVASPNNNAYTVRTVAGGKVTLDKPYAHIRIGLPYLGDTYTLDIDTPSGPTLKDSKMAVTRSGMFVQASRGVFTGTTPPTNDAVDPLENLDEVQLRDDTTSTSDPIEAVTDYVFADIAGEWNRNGRLFIRQVDPVPFTLLAVFPQGYIVPAGQS